MCIFEYLIRGLGREREEGEREGEEGEGERERERERERGECFCMLRCDILFLYVMHTHSAQFSCIVDKQIKATVYILRLFIHTYTHKHTIFESI